MAADEEPTSRDEQARQTREHIRETALAMFARHGYAGTSVSRIADEANVSEGLVYHHFTSKKGLLRAVAEGRETFADAVAEQLEGASGEPAEETMRAIGEAFVQVLGTDNPEVHLVVMLIGESQTNPELHELFRQTIDDSAERIGDYLRTRIEAGELREDLPVEGSARSFLGALMLFFMTRSHLEGEAWKGAARKHVDEVIEHWLRGARRRDS